MLVAGMKVVGVERTASAAETTAKRRMSGVDP
jgi:hypothetical protein